MGGGTTESELGSDCAIERQNQHHQQSTLMGVTEAFDPFEDSNTGAITTTTSATTGVDDKSGTTTPQWPISPGRSHSFFLLYIREVRATSIIYFTCLDYLPWYFRKFCLPSLPRVYVSILVIENGKTVSSPDQVMAARKQHKGNQLPPSSSPSSVFIHL